MASLRIFTKSNLQASKQIVDSLEGRTGILLVHAWIENLSCVLMNEREKIMFKIAACVLQICWNGPAWFLDFHSNEIQLAVLESDWSMKCKRIVFIVNDWSCWFSVCFRRTASHRTTAEGPEWAEWCLSTCSQHLSSEPAYPFGKLTDEWSVEQKVLILFWYVVSAVWGLSIKRKLKTLDGRGSWELSSSSNLAWWKAIWLDSGRKVQVVFRLRLVAFSDFLPESLILSWKS